MNDPFELLTVFAEIQVGFLGFSALVSVMSKSSWDKKEVALRFWSILALGFIGLVLSLGPIILSLVFSDSVAVWRVACGIGLAGWIANIMIITTRFAKLFRAKQVNLVSPWANLLFQIPFGASIILFAIGFVWGGHSRAYFFGGLFFFTLAAAGNFVTFLAANSKARTLSADKEGE